MNVSYIPIAEARGMTHWMIRYSYMLQKTDMFDGKSHGANMSVLFLYCLK